MTNLALLAEHILNQTVIGKWEPKAELLGLVAVRTEPTGSWTQLGVNELMACGYDRGAALWARTLLQRMATEDRVLSRIAGGPGRPDLYRIRGDRLSQLEGWRHVPWSSSARDAIRALRAIEAVVRPELGTVRAGQTPFSRTVPPSDEVIRHGRSAGHDQKSPFPAPEEPFPAPEPPGETGPRTVPGSGGAAPSTQCLWRSIDLPPSLGREGGRDSELEEAFQRLRRSLRDQGHKVDGAAFQDRLARIVVRNVDRIDDLDFYIRTGGLAGWHKVAGALLVLENWTPPDVAPARTSSPEWVAKRRETIRAQLPLYEDDPDRREQLLAELEQLEDLHG